MIVCSCNVFSDAEVHACLGSGSDCPRTPAQVHRCLGCSPQCGGCAKTIRSIIAEATSATGFTPMPCPEGLCGADCGTDCQSASKKLHADSQTDGASASAAV
jgi:bacterioferritin-associated ferredoxin